MSNKTPFDINGHLAGSMPLHPQWPSYMNKPWYAEDYSSSEQVCCPHCGQNIVAYTYNFRNTFCEGLLELAGKVDPLTGLPTWAHVNDLSTVTRGEHAKISAWGLIETMPAGPKAKGPRSGMWRVTDTGMAFLQGHVGIPKRIIQYMSNIIGFCGPIRTYQECRKDKLCYQDLIVLKGAP